MNNRKKKSDKYRKKRAKRGLKRHLKAKKREKANKKSYFYTSKRTFSKLIRYFKEKSIIPKNVDSHNNNYLLKVPSRFSFIEEPNESLDTILSLISYISDPDIESLRIDHSNCQHLDIAASTIMDVLMMEVKKECFRKKRYLSLSGKYSDSNEVNELLKVTGLIKHLKHKDSNVPDSILKNYEVFDLVIGGNQVKTKSKESSKAEIEGTKLTDYLNNLLIKNGVELTARGKNRAITLITEVLDNAEQHSGNNTWYMLGYLDKNMICNITIFNFGESIGQTLSSAPLTKEIRNNINSLIKTHTSRGFFDLGNNWDEENLWTLYALQEGVSRFNTDDPKGERDRGQGTTKMIDFFLNLGYTDKEYNKPKMVLISGNSYILFDGSYKIQDKMVNGEPRQVIAFNEENDLKLKPDNNCVRKLNNYFPGTIISMKFTLNQNYLNKIADGS